MKRRSLSELRALVERGAPYGRRLLAELKADTRAGAQALHATCKRAQAEIRREGKRLEHMFSFERDLHGQGFTRVAGVDEAGRGPFAGPIVAAAVILKEPVEGLNDSKQLEPEERERLFGVLMAGEHTIGVAAVDVETIDRYGIQQANYSAMAQAVAQLAPEPEFLLVDGFNLPGVRQPQTRLIKGDGRSLSIAAASIVAKVTRDRIMVELDLQYPGYGFGKHKGYGTPEHYEQIERLGPCPIHRRSWSPIAQVIETGSLFDLDEVKTTCE
jgi:ribonuclease HII